MSGSRADATAFVACPREAAWRWSAFHQGRVNALGLGSFKALGGAHAVLQIVLEKASQEVGRRIAPEELVQPEISAIARRLTVACATDGNHGRSVAAGARFTGCRAVIFIHAGVSEERAAAIAAFGAELRRVEGVYADAVAAAARAATVAGWNIVSDTAWPDYERTPQLVMQGYTVMVREAIDGMPVPPTHVFVQAGVGGLATAVAGHLVSTLGKHRPRIVIVEPERSACLLASHDAGERVVIAQDRPTVMAMLECQEPSFTAWRVLSRLADAFLSVDEDDAVQRCGSSPIPPAKIPPSWRVKAAARFTGLAVAVSSQEIREALDVSDKSIVLLFNTEGATDSASYTRLVGRTPEQVAARMRV